MAGRERGHRLSVHPAHGRENTRRALAGRVLCEQRVRELPLHAHDLAAVALERERRPGEQELFPFTQKPSEMTSGGLLPGEGFAREGRVRAERVELRSLRIPLIDLRDCVYIPHSRNTVRTGFG